MISPSAGARRRIAGTVLIGALIGALVAASAAQAATEFTDPGFAEQEIVGGLQTPTAVAFAPDGHVLVTEKRGVLQLVSPGTPGAAPLLDISAEVNSYGDRGLLGVAVDSHFGDATNPQRYVYVLYTHELDQVARDGSSPMTSMLERLTIDGQWQVSARKVLLGADGASAACPTPSTDTSTPAARKAPKDCIPSDGASHSIGTVRSAPDGTLYLGSGDSASYSSVDVPHATRTYNENSFSGKIMHVTRQGSGVSGHPFCPTDADVGNGTSTDPGDVCTKLYAKGFRNPFRFALRPGGGLIVGDVGWTRWEEVDVLTKGGGDYGWPCYEGQAKTNGYKDDTTVCPSEYAKEGTASAAIGPDYLYGHVPPPNGSGSIIGGPQYTGSKYPAKYSDSIFFGDYSLGFMKRLVLGTDGKWQAQDFATGWGGVDIEQTPEGELAYVDIFENSVKRIVAASGSAPDVSKATASPTSGAQHGTAQSPFTVQFGAQAVTDPDGGTVTYAWDFGDGQTSTSRNPSHGYIADADADGKAFRATLTATDDEGLRATKAFRISPGNTPPRAAPTPASGSLYTDGQTVQLNAHATDAEDDAAGKPLDVTWDVQLIHASHIHYLQTLTGQTPSFQTLSDHDADSHFVVKLTVTDSVGMTDTKTISLSPRTVPFALASSPGGVALSYGGQSATTPFSTRSAIGFKTTITAPATFKRGGHTYTFSSWSDGGARVHDITIPASAQTITARYTTPASQRPSSPPAPKHKPPADTAGPRLTFDPANGLIRRRRLLYGTASDPSGVKEVEVALGRRRGKACRFLSRRFGRLGRHRHACSKPVWIRARLRKEGDHVIWKVRLGRPLRHGAYRVLLRGADGKGHAASRLADGRPMVRLSVRRGRR